MVTFGRFGWAVLEISDEFLGFGYIEQEDVVVLEPSDCLGSLLPITVLVVFEI